ncbi:hypothetical protein FSP39_020918 [Pinctada imbricata]|uniref:Uncharacterized protein n=1 Tax=Pinctada imbricata TaxID=66713 RepID=A0AA89BRN3_PINIB|nr:hypothetical protein FSP39_020918 [Pinctada imbricata]
MLSELGEIKSDMVKHSDIETIVTSIVTEIMKVHKEEFDKRLNEIEEKNDKIKGHLQEQIDGLSMENEVLREKLAEKNKQIMEQKTTISDAMRIAQEAQVRSNYNEQYSRKSNIKIYGMKEEKKEDTPEEVIRMLSDVANVVLREDEIVAAHRIPGRAGQNRPILLKVKNTSVKSRIMKKRSVVKKLVHGLRLADDVTKLNSSLIDCLNAHDSIESAWYFNGNIYGKAVNGDRRIKFDIYDDIPKKVHNKA